jgi:hypothetical protein
MEANQNIEKVYELLEQFDFHELTTQDKEIILTQITEEEYTKMRSTVKDTLSLFENAEDLYMNTLPRELNYRDNYLMIRLLKQPIQLYKVAASIAILFGIMLTFQYLKPKEKSNYLASIDTVYINKTDTVYSKIIDTVTILKDVIVYLPQNQKLALNSELKNNTKIKYDCKSEFCPDDIDVVMDLAFNDNASKDTLLKEIVNLAN